MSEFVTTSESRTVTAHGIFNNNIISITIHGNVASIAGSAFDDCKSLKEIIVDSENTLYISEDGILYEKIKKKFFGGCIRCPEGKEGAVEIPVSVSHIYSEAFVGCSKLASVTILSEEMELGDETIEESIFDDCSEGFCIYCLKGSYAKSYAKKYGIKYEVIKKFQSIWLDESELTGNVGDTYDIQVLSEGDGELTYVSSDETIVTVSESGMLTFVGIGTAEIIITASETDEWYETQEIISVTVNDRQKEEKPDEEQTPDEEQKPNEEQTPGEEEKPNAGPPTEEEQKPNEEQKQEAEKKEQIITAKNIKKTYGAKSFNIGAKTDGGGTLTYSVENKKIAQVDKNGKVTIKGCGVTNIVISAAENGNYNAATKKITLTVVPKKAILTSVKSTKTRTITVKWKKDTKASGYIIEYSIDKKFKKNVGKVMVSKNKTTSKKISKLKAGKKYYVRVCAYTVSKGNKIKGAYTKAKMVKVKK